MFLSVTEKFFSEWTAKSAGFAQRAVVRNSGTNWSEGNEKSWICTRLNDRPNLDRQIAALRAERCDEIYREKASGKDVKGRPQLEKAVDALGTGDVLVVAEWDRATRSMQDGVALIGRIAERGALLKALDRDYLDLTKPINRGILAFLSARLR